MAQWARRGMKRRPPSWADNLCTVNVQDGVIMAGTYQPGLTLAKNAEAAADLLLHGGGPVTMLWTLLDELCAAWAALFAEPELAPDLAHLVDEANPAFETADRANRAALAGQGDVGWGDGEGEGEDDGILICAE